MIIKDYYPSLFNVLNGWCQEGGKPPLFISPIDSFEWENIKEEVITLLLPVNNSQIRKDYYNSADIVLLEKDKDKENIGMEKTRQFIRELNLSSAFLPYKIGLIPNAESLNIPSQNVLLKTLEEPRKNRYIFLFGDSQAQILPTLMSRCIFFELRQASHEKTKEYLETMFSNLDVEKLENISLLAKGRINLANKIAKEYPFYEEILKIYKNAPKQSVAERLTIAKELPKLSLKNTVSFFEAFALLNYRDLKNGFQEKNVNKIKRSVELTKKSLEFIDQAKKSSGTNLDLLMESFLLNC